MANMIPDLDELRTFAKDHTLGEIVSHFQVDIHRMYYLLSSNGIPWVSQYERILKDDDITLTTIDSSASYSNNLNIISTKLGITRNQAKVRIDRLMEIGVLYTENHKLKQSTSVEQAEDIQINRLWKKYQKIQAYSDLTRYLKHRAYILNERENNGRNLR